MNFASIIACLPSQNQGDGQLLELEYSSSISLRTDDCRSPLSVNIRYIARGFRWIVALEAFCERTSGNRLLVPKHFHQMEILEGGVEEWYLKPTGNLTAIILFVAEADWANWLQTTMAEYLLPIFSDPQLTQQLAGLIHHITLMDMRLLKSSEANLSKSVVAITALDRFMHSIPTQEAMVGHEEERIYAAVDELMEQLDSKITVASIAMRTGINASRVQDLFLVLFGQSVQSFFFQVRMEQAKSILLNQNTTIRELAMKLAFSSASYFSRLFKEYAGVSPAVYRAMVRVDDARAYEKRAE